MAMPRETGSSETQSFYRRRAIARLQRLLAIASLLALLPACGGQGTSGARSPNQPLITLQGARVVDQPLGKKYVDAGATAEDAKGGDITARVVVTGLDKLDVNTSGDYLVRYNVTSSRGKRAIEAVRIVRVHETGFAAESARPLGTTGARMGYYEHLPTDYSEDSSRQHPLLIWNHGYGNSRDFGAPGHELDLLKSLDIFQMIQSSGWDDSLPFVVLMPQRDTRDTGEDAGLTKLKAFVDYAVRTYNIDSSRIYMMGFSDGAYVTWQYLAFHPNQLAAAVPIAGYSPYADACAIKSTPVWAFQTKDDDIVPWKATLATVDLVNTCHPKERARLTLFSGGGHTPMLVLDTGDVGEGEPAYDSYDPDVYSWLLEYHR
jgi:predicted esterase